jgi:cytidylate kinase
VREFLLETQKSIARTHSVIMDGRDIGTVILPNADVKIFLFASDEARALRRTKELEAKGMTVSYEDVLREMRERDAQDRNREVAPAVPAEDAIPFDNSAMTVEESIEKLLEIVRERVPSAR